MPCSHIQPPTTMQLDNIQLKKRNVHGGISYESEVFSQWKNPEMLAYVQSQEKIGETPDDEDPSKIKSIYRIPNGMIAIVDTYTIIIYRSLEDYQSRQKAVKLGEGKNELEQYKKLQDTREPRPRAIYTQTGEKVPYLQYSTNLPDVSAFQPLAPLAYGKAWLDKQGFYWLNWLNARRYLQFSTAAYMQAWIDHIMLEGDLRQWKSRNPYQKNILEKRKEIQAQFAEMLGLEALSLEEVSVHGSRQIHQAMRRHVFTDEFIHAVFLPLTLYLGDLYIKMKRGNWIIRHDDKIDTWIPLIQLENGRIFDIGTDIYYDLLENEDEPDFFPPLMEVFRRAR